MRQTGRLHIRLDGVAKESHSGKWAGGQNGNEKGQIGFLRVLGLDSGSDFWPGVMIGFMGGQIGSRGVNSDLCVLLHSSGFTVR